MIYRAIMSAFRLNSHMAIGPSIDVEAESSDGASREAGNIIVDMICDIPSLRWPEWVAEIMLFAPNDSSPAIYHIRNNPEDRDGEAETITLDEYRSLRRGGVDGE